MIDQLRRIVTYRSLVGCVLVGCVFDLGSAGVLADRDHPIAASARATSPIVIAHRGASHVAPENTYRAFRAAIDRGADRIEMDVQRTKDHRLVLFHDARLRRTTNVEWVYPHLNNPSVGDLTFRQLRRLDAGRWKGQRWKGTTIPRLSRVLALGKRRHVRMLVELKTPARSPGLVAQTLRMLGKRHLMRRAHHDLVQLQSFDIHAMRRAARRSRLVDIGLLCPNPPVRLDHHRWAQSIDSNHAAVRRRWVRRAQRLGIEVFVWGVNTKRTSKRAMRMGVDGISTNRPKYTRRIIDYRGRT